METDLGVVTSLPMFLSSVFLRLFDFALLDILIVIIYIKCVLFLYRYQNFTSYTFHCIFCFTYYQI